MLVLDLSKKPRYYNHHNHHVSYGIQVWLRNSGNCLCLKNHILDEFNYKMLLIGFMISEGADYSHFNFGRMERFIDNRFVRFCNYCVRINRKKE